MKTRIAGPVVAAAVSLVLLHSSCPAQPASAQLEQSWKNSDNFAREIKKQNEEYRKQWGASARAYLAALRRSLENLVSKKATCPFLGSAVASRELVVQNGMDDPLASIEDVVRLGNSGGDCSASISPDRRARIPVTAEFSRATRTLSTRGASASRTSIV